MLGRDAAPRLAPWRADRGGRPWRRQMPGRRPNSADDACTGTLALSSTVRRAGRIRIRAARFAGPWSAKNADLIPVRGRASVTVAGEDFSAVSFE